MTSRPTQIAALAAGAILSLTSRPALALPAFPCAEGFGADSLGGRGGAVIKVTSLDDDGPGSFRQAVTTPGARLVVFEVSGIINLASNINIADPFLTIAGQTSPGGVLITGRTVTINTHDVVVQYMRFRVGSHEIVNGADPEQLDSLVVIGRHWAANEAYNVMIDHCSVGWGVDECLSLSGGVTDTTVQWTLVSEGLSNAGHPKGEHSKGLLISGKYVEPNSVTLHHNYIANNVDRNPQIASPEEVDTVVAVVNNVSYNWKGGLAPVGIGNAKINWVHNFAKQGPNSHAYSFEVTHIPDPTPIPQLYVHGNLGSTRLDQSEDHWNVGVSWQNEALDQAWEQTTPWPAPPVTTTEMSAAYADEILATVGASLPVRDSADQKAIDDYHNGTGDFVDDVAYPADFPQFTSSPAPADADNDGMPDAWEESHGLDSASDDSALDPDADGYTNIEDYLHSLSVPCAAGGGGTGGGTTGPGGTGGAGAAGQGGTSGIGGGDPNQAVDSGSDSGCGCQVIAPEPRMGFATAWLLAAAALLRRRRDPRR
ncbi:MAG: hypothetical protein JRI68_23955 [Deltaproteobacteria bacterium]|nr:hypothetical protein [Deltaproteobacteria bacterium]